MDRHLLARASRMFNATADLRDERDREINEWFKEQLRAAERCAVCDRTRDSELHYVGTVDSHEFVAPPAALGHAGSVPPPNTKNEKT